jgi:hypothetical protein
MDLNAETLQAVLDKGDVNDCLALFAGRSEKERQAVANLAATLISKQAKEIMLQTGPGTFSRNPKFDMARVAALACCSLAQLKKIGWRGIPEDETAYQVLADRRPDWLEEWSKMALEIQPRNFSLVRRLVREELCSRPNSENYWLGMLHSDELGRFGKVRDGLLADPGLLDEIWKLFEIEGNGENSLAARDKYSRPENTWEMALVELAAEGKLPRDRLIDSSLDALARDFAQFRASWFSRFHEALKPTLEERVSRADRYLQLLASKIPPTMSFALNALAILDKAGKLPGQAVVEQIGSALLARSNGTVLAALKLLGRAAQAERGQQPRIAKLAVEALKHEAAEVQGAALDLIQQLGNPADKELATVLREQSVNLAASQRNRLAEWLKSDGPKSAAKTSKEDDKELKTLLQRAKGLDKSLSKLAGIDEALAAVDAVNFQLSALEFDGTEIPRLRPDQKIVPIQDLEQLIDCFAAVLENPEATDDVEQVLDGVSRLCDQHPDNFDKLTGPLRKRAEDLLIRNRWGPFAGCGLGADLCALAIAWTSAEIPTHRQSDVTEPHRTRTVYQYVLRGKPVEFYPHQHGFFQFLSKRLLAIAQRAAKQRPAPLLSNPTHAGGWIDPVELIKRTNDWENMGKAGDLTDQVLALLRLAPDGRAKARAPAGKLTGEFGRALRYALGESEKLGGDVALWTAAARSRAPYSDDPSVDRQFPDLGPDTGRTACYRIEVKCRKHAASGKTYEFFYLAIEVEPQSPKAVAHELVPVLFHTYREKQTAVWGYHCDPATLRWLHSLWPVQQESLFATGSAALAHNLDWWEAHWEHRIFLEPLLDHDVPLKPMALLLLILGLAAKEPGEHGLATDALIAVIDDGRLDGCKLGTALASLLHTGLVKAARWAKTLGQVARTSPLHIEVIASAIQHALTGDPTRAPKDLQSLLEQLKELLIAAEAAISVPDARRYLEGIKASGKTGKLVRELLALEGTSTGEHAKQVAIRALAGRVDRAERWAGSL